MFSNRSQVRESTYQTALLCLFSDAHASLKNLSYREDTQHTTMTCQNYQTSVPDILPCIQHRGLPNGPLPPKVAAVARMLMRFVNPTTVVCHNNSARADANFAACLNSVADTKHYDPLCFDILRAVIT